MMLLFVKLWRRRYVKRVLYVYTHFGVVIVTVSIAINSSFAPLKGTKKRAISGLRQANSDGFLVSN